MENGAVNLELVAAFIDENYAVGFEAVLLYFLYDIAANIESICYESWKTAPHSINKHTSSDRDFAVKIF